MILRASYKTPIVLGTIFSGVLSSILLGFELPQTVFWWLFGIDTVVTALLLSMLLAWVIDFLKLTAKGFSLPSVYFYRHFLNWSDVDLFEAFERRTLGIQVRGVGFNYSDSFWSIRIPGDKSPRATRFSGHDRAIVNRYGNMDAHELAAYLNEWRRKYAHTDR